MPDSNDNKNSPKDFFSKYADNYAKSVCHSQGSDLDSLVAFLKPKSDEIMFDIATGTGFTAMEFAPRVREVIATDITSEMLSKATSLAQERGIKNMKFEIADAAKLPYHDSSFDIVTCRRAPHHFPDILKFIQEAKRVLKKGGRLGIADMSPREGTEEFINKIECLRDPSHAIALSATQWKSLLEGTGLEITGEKIVFETVTFEQWLSPVKTGGREEIEIRREWENASTSVRELVNLKGDADGRVEGWTRSLVVLEATKK